MHYERDGMIKMAQEKQLEKSQYVYVFLSNLNYFMTCDKRHSIFSNKCHIERLIMILHLET
jgi:hypothetical protein